MTEYGLKDSISTITGKPQPAFDDKVKVAKGVGQGLKDYVKGLYYNINPSAGPETIYESVAMPRAVKQTALSARSLWKDPKAVDEIYEKIVGTLGRAEKKYLNNASKISPERFAKAKQEIVKDKLQSVMRDHALDIANTPQAMLDPINKFAHIELGWDVPGSASPQKYIDYALGSYGNTTKSIYLNPLKYDPTVVKHEATHGLQDFWSSPQRMIDHKTGVKSMSPEEMNRFHRTRFLDAPAEKWQGTEKYIENYKRIPSEINAQRTAEYVTNTQKKIGKVMSDEDAIKLWDDISEAQAKRMKTANPDLYEISKNRVKSFEEVHPEVTRYKLSDGFKNTQEAVDYGTKAKPHQVNKLTKYYKKSLAKQEQFKANKDYQSWMDEATRGQFYREALDASLGKHPLQKGGKK
jgi:hypothetical protein